MNNNEIKEEIKSYVKVVETHYNEAIKDLKVQNERLVKKCKKIQGERVNQVSEKGEIETLFIECIEEVRKEIMKRRLKSEIMQKKKGMLPLANLTHDNNSISTNL